MTYAEKLAQLKEAFEKLGLSAAVIRALFADVIPHVPADVKNVVKYKDLRVGDHFQVVSSHTGNVWVICDAVGRLECIDGFHKGEVEYFDSACFLASNTLVHRLSTQEWHEL